MKCNTQISKKLVCPRPTVLLHSVLNSVSFVAMPDVHAAETETDY